MLKNLLDLQINLAQSIVQFEDFRGTILEFFAVNKTAFDGYDFLSIVTHLIAQGYANIDTGNGTYVKLELVELKKADIYSFVQLAA
jgi:hypothetical protein